MSTTIGLVVVATLLGTGALSAGWANVVATAAGTGPSFELNRRWVWGKQGRSSLRAEVVPFAVLSFASLGLSTLAVSLAASWADRAGLSTTGRVAVALGANVASFGTMWVVQYLVLDRLLFRDRRSRVDAREREVTDRFWYLNRVIRGLDTKNEIRVRERRERREGSLPASSEEALNEPDGRLVPAAAPRGMAA
jgi:putative flippase GtrA